MSIGDFDYLDSYSKTEALNVFAVLLAERREGCFQISLYQLQGFYVEMYFHLGQQYYISIRSFNDVGELNPYLDQIDIGLVYEWILDKS